MKWLFSLVLFIIALAIIGFWNLTDPGHVEILWLGIEYKSTAVMSLILFSCLFFSLILVMSIAAWILKIPSHIRAYFDQSKESKAHQDFLAFIMYYEAENFTEAHYHQQRAGVLLSKNPFFLWYSGLLNMKTNNLFEAGQYFFELKKNPSTTFLGLKGSTQVALQNSDFNGASSLLEQAEKIIPKSPWVLRQHLLLAQERHASIKVEEVSHPQASLRDAEGFAPTMFHVKHF